MRLAHQVGGCVSAAMLKNGMVVEQQTVSIALIQSGLPEIGDCVFAFAIVPAAGASRRLPLMPNTQLTLTWPLVESWWCRLDQLCHADVLLEFANGRG